MEHNTLTVIQLSETASPWGEGKDGDLRNFGNGRNL
jgi:hypothetical protein